MRLSKADLLLAHEATLDLHEPRDTKALREAAPAIFKRVIPADYFARMESGRDSLADLDGDALIWDSPTRWTPELLRAGMAMIDQHPFTPHVMRTGELAPMRLSDFWTREQQLASPIHRKVYGPIGIGRLLSQPYLRGRRAGSVSLSRPLRARDFSERDRRLMAWLVPHFVLALQAAEALTSARSAEAGVLARLGLTPREMLVAAWLARGRTNAEIASILAMKTRTVEKHVEKILAKLGAGNRTRAARIILGAAAGEDGADAPPASPLAMLGRVLRPSRAERRR